jgi:hypothetical protein
VRHAVPDRESVRGGRAGQLTETAVGIATIPAIRRVATVAQLRILNESLATGTALEGDPTTDRIELYITPVGADLEDEDPDFFGLRMGSDTGYFGQLPGNYDLTIAKVDTATTNPAPTTVLLRQTMTLDANGIYTLVIIDSVGGVAPISFLPLDDDPTP